MNSRVLKLGTRRSALARAQSAAVARLLQQQHPGLTVELVGIETQGDRILDKPLSTVDGKEFFTAEIDAALLSGAVEPPVAGGRSQARTTVRYRPVRTGRTRAIGGR